MDILVRHLDSAFGPEECRGRSVGGVVRVTDIAPDFLTLSLLSFDMVRQSIERTSIAACIRIRLFACPAIRIWSYSAPHFVVSVHVTCGDRDRMSPRKCKPFLTNGKRQI